MRDLPTGTVTFLFIDVEGSTKLLTRLGERYRDVQQRYYTIVRAAIAEAEGDEVSTEGDSFFAVFRTPRGAIHAAVRGQRDLAATTWPDGIVFRVRMGLHTGEGVLGGDNYLGLDVNRAARIAAAAHGGQILISDGCRALVERGLPPGTRLRDLGRHGLKDLAEPEQLHQVVVEGLESDFPPPKTLDARPNNLPAQLARFIGREAEIARVRELLTSNRLVTLTGIGGTGKTRLALQAAADSLDDFVDGVFFVDLSAIDDAELVPERVAAALRVAEVPSRPLLETLGDHLVAKELLLVLDNFEQLVDEEPNIVEPMLRAAARLRILVTSRVPLRLYGEQQFPVPPLGLSSRHPQQEPDAIATSEAVALFAVRAAATKPDFRVTEANATTVAEIAARLDGLPLAIELAASRVKLLTPELLLEQLEQRLPLLAARDRSVPERQRTLRGTIEWSHDLLGPRERMFFARLTVFAGFDLEAVDAVVNPNGELGVDTFDALSTLLDNSLIRTDPAEAEGRFGMLETIREFGLERLRESGEEGEIHRRHAEHWIVVAEHARAALEGPEQAHWTRVLERDHDNLRAALAWALRVEDADLGLRLASSLEPFWRLVSHVPEGMRWVEELLGLPGATQRTLVRARALNTAASLLGSLDDPEASLAYSAEALDIFRELGDAGEVAASLSNVGWAYLQAGRADPARATLLEARELHAQLGERQEESNCSTGLGVLALSLDRTEEARALFEEALTILRDLQNPFWLALTEIIASGVDVKEEKWEAANERIQAALLGFREIDNVMGTAWTLYTAADVALQRGESERALRLAAASKSLLQGADLPSLVIATMGDIPAMARARLDAATADRAYAEGLSMDLEEAVAYALT